ncbi:flagellar biosynthesis anti-sigma factor FlgM [Candidimonas sp. SYP-B2681]|uniref:flagellar biosynthesis anti-sigma factor FlgM n=1 Tax=Candidimonas sp. SYP-B2681 TaxID=2497686 RepID=UPI000F875C28|nr:flagellar biosynthesis anti-sigma factor FlgM [Candidimonas sp. SYP-B2681]RTZ47539.1 flagellar biosynthesis anti-sigma factor FlgM [Candidimonas sp. SYP-B2681]
MKITSPSINSPARSVPGSRTDGVASSSVTSSSASAGSKGGVELSSTARHLSNLQNSDNDINMARVNEIRDALASGQLKIDASKIADGLIASVRDLLK